jgi:outer membrane lipoprotein SlyB
MKKLIATIALITTSLLTGCATQATAQTDAGTVMNIKYVYVNGGTSGVGAFSGAALGGLAGSRVGQGSGRTAATLVGAVAGGAFGRGVERNMNQYQAADYVVMLDSGIQIAVSQQVAHDLSIGDRVRVMGSGRSTYIMP